jgi:hypothetical protein
MGPLTEHHRCPRNRFSRVTEAMTTVGLGAFAGGGICIAAVTDPTAALLLASAALGAVLARAVRDAMGPLI